MTTRLNPYLNFNGNAREAMTFYHSVFSGELSLSTFGENQMSQDPSDAEKIMHGQLETDGGLLLMGADIPNGMSYTEGDNFSVSLSGEDEEELRGYWEKLSGSGTVTVPLERAPWGDSFGMCKDQFGVDWLVNISGA
ncbi:MULTISPECIES: VOC family protein [unclassified Arthrobacter]|uniref:VOC family protein n=1 Tax=unclassified Arthrobacter TaxID=235627 RepID=UPI001492A9A8|nr:MULTISPECIES: VOC family protein [unclassified Arthrobacter]MBE0010636.1 VOC family protein [Arthrobacter sp. AET 35A]NOJ59636.1 VOC family protein [Arthrobacter sp. 260]NOJ64497.1 VOC family protein [Arthrobacter sp. 147(2020)]